MLGTVPADIGEVLEFLRLIWALDHRLQKTSKKMKTVLGVTGPQRLVLRMVGRFPGISAGHLAQLLHVHPSTLTGVLKRLEDRGLILRRSDSRDARRSLFGLSPKGRRLDTKVEGTVEEAVRKALARLPREAVESARQVLVMLRTMLDPTDQGPV